MKPKTNKMDTKTWAEIKEIVYMAKKERHVEIHWKGILKHLKLASYCDRPGKKKNLHNNNLAIWLTKKGLIFQEWKTMEAI